MGDLKQALEFATKAHEGQTRKVSQKPYIQHPIGVATILQEAGMTKEVVMAGYLHDTVEDTPITIEDIEREFGKQVATIVQGNTEEKEWSWKDRKAHTIQYVGNVSLAIRALIVADKLHNLRSMKEDVAILGSEEKLWEMFKAGKKDQAWYFEGVAENCTKGLTSSQIPSFFYTFQEEVQAFFKS